ncbi:MAG TPA: hypothetical protein VGO47_12370, partial [Chlamydiales bacterium]|nr:hypothetical protein [Chlamydiales bacterium]
QFAAKTRAFVHDLIEKPYQATKERIVCICFYSFLTSSSLLFELVIHYVRPRAMRLLRLSTVR